MKLNEIKPFFESSDQMQEHFFSIQDTGMIFDILRSKMYSNPILAICREITCNARDAHREVNKSDVPIVIHLPNSLEPEYRVKDFGPGISPDRMLNIFIKYTASTKRDDNVQTGGFGLGAKTPFSYADQFAVNTVFNGIKYSYVCSIDSTRVGKLTLLDQRSTDEPNGTEIVIGIKTNDFNLFRQWTEQACRHWDVKPNITGGANFVWTEHQPVIEGKKWSIITNVNNSSAHTGYNDHEIKLIIDGIEYPLEINTLRKYADTKLIDACHGTLIMSFEVGELSLSANREHIYLDKMTQDKLKMRLNQITQEIKDLVIEKINNFPNLWEANIYYRSQLVSVFSNLNFLSNLEWRGTPLHTYGNIHLGCKIFHFRRGKYSRKYGTDPNKLSRVMQTSLLFEKDTLLYINDLNIKEPSPKHVKKAFDDPKTQKIVVICPDAVHTEEVLNKNFHLDKMEPIKLSSIFKSSGRNYTAPTSRLLIFKFDKLSYSTPTAFRQVSYDAMEEDTNNKVLCLLNRQFGNGTRTPLYFDKKHLTINLLQSLALKNPNISFYGIDQETNAKRIEDDFSDFEKIDSFMHKIVSNQSANYIEIKIALHHHHIINDKMMQYLPKLEKLIIDKDSLFLTRLKLYNKLSQFEDGDYNLLETYESVKGVISGTEIADFIKSNPNYDIDAINEKYRKKYPLIEYLPTYNLKDIVEDIANYINLIDKN